MKWVGDMRSQTQWVYDPLESAQLREVAVGTGTGGDWIAEGFMVLMAPFLGARRHSTAEYDGGQQEIVGGSPGLLCRAKWGA